MALSEAKHTTDDTTEEILPDPADPLTADAMAAQHSADYMVWQDEAGHVGFSNVQYPQQKTIQQYQAGEWVAVTPIRETAGDTADFADVEKTSGQDDVAAVASEKFIVWRDADGHIGISNVQPPIRTEALEIHNNGEWLAAVE
jgi:hypothetical protein